jgi:hypothetical protein
MARTIYIQHFRGRAIANAPTRGATPSDLTTFPLKLNTAEPIDVVFFSQNAVQMALPDSSSISLGIKQRNNLDAAGWLISGWGPYKMGYGQSTRYRFILQQDSEELRQLIGNSTSLALALEIRYNIGLEVRSTQIIEAPMENTLHRTSGFVVNPAIPIGQLNSIQFFNSIYELEGDTGSLQSIATETLSALQIVGLIHLGTLKFYRLQEDDLEHNGTTVIRPADYDEETNMKVWVQVL